MILCHVHPEMAAFVVVVPARYWATVENNGRFRLEGVPPGLYTLRVWHRRVHHFAQSIVVPANGVLRLELDVGREGGRP